MGKKNYIVFILLMSIFSYSQFQFFSIDSSQLVRLYEGPDFRSNSSILLFYFFQFCCYALFLFKKSENFVKGYGILLLVKSKSIFLLIKKIFQHTASLVLLGETTKLVVYICLNLIMNKQILIGNGSFIVVLYALNIVILLFLLMSQMFAELFIDARVVLFFILACFLTLFVIANSLFYMMKDAFINRLNFVNYMYSNRLLKIDSSIMTHWFIPLGSMMVLLIFLSLVALVLAKRKDWL